ncbi:hypothetical protein [Parafrankia sp. EUN1f]|uniref:hypothetical protein n=1 Tax=Parafrankia sp. EUN1f TaxID=102897 RepID=UPI0001C459A6|nr:hypothetical protein [Parafrankia sp. EUN1f]EFC86493.1 hypothetical protein FrEUN1fDRAFT_0388 [Parafrankia sp. EUN1f]
MESDAATAELHRAANLITRPGEPAFESLYDTAQDIAGYGAILALVLSGEWPGVEP